MDGLYLSGMGLSAVRLLNVFSTFTMIKSVMRSTIMSWERVMIPMR